MKLLPVGDFKNIVERCFKSINSMIFSQKRLMFTVISDGKVQIPLSKGVFKILLRKPYLVRASRSGDLAGGAELLK